MNTLIIPEKIQVLLDSVVDCGEEKYKVVQLALQKERDYAAAKRKACELLHEEAGGCDEIANYFFSEEGVLYRGQIFTFDDEGELIVAEGPIIAEVQA